METEKRKIKFGNKIVGILVLLVLLLFIGYSAASENNSTSKFVEKISEIEIWAKTFISLEATGETIGAVLSLDNGTEISEQELDFYLDGVPLNSSITNSEGYVEIFFGDYNFGAGNYSFKSVFQGNQILFFNASFTEKQIEILNQDEVREIRIIEQGGVWENVTELNRTEVTADDYLFVKTDKQNYIKNETISISGGIISDDKYINLEGKLEFLFEGEIIFGTDFGVVNGLYNYSLVVDFEKEGEYVARVSLGNLSNQTVFYFSNVTQISDLEGFICKEFSDSVLFSSGYTHNKKGSTNYDTWEVQTNCTEAGGRSCSLHNINTKSRILYSNPYDEEIAGESYVQISELDESNCNNPEKEEYSKYLVHDIPKQEGGKWERYCEKNKTSDSKCEIESSENYYGESTCYGIKTYASQYSIVDVVEIKYTWCWEK